MVIFVYTYFKYIVHVPILIHHTYMDPMGHGFLTYPLHLPAGHELEDDDFSISQVRYYTLED